MRKALVLMFTTVILAAAADAPQAKVSQQDLRTASDAQYARIMLEAVKAGRRYSREDAASGANRHYINLRDRYEDAGFEITVPEIMP